jgi:hypothetical protein
VTTLEKAVLEELDKGGKVVDTVPVQFNPTSLKLQMTNSVDGAASRGRQVQQYNGSASTALSVELEFDTADEGTTAEPVDVRTRTGAVARFVLPGGKGSKQAPPRVQFRWGTLIVAGVMSSLSEQLDLFSAGGVPLRAKVNVDIKEQDARYEALERGPGANPATGAAPAGEPGSGAGPGSSSTGDGPDSRTAEALDGESAADFLARNGLDPSAWRAIAGALDDPLSLSAGIAVDFSASLSIEAGIGVSAGFAAGLEVSLEASLGLEVGATAAVGASAGFALVEAGGITAAAQAAAATRATADADRAKAAFGAPAAAPAPATNGAAGRIPLTASASSRTLGPAPAAPQPLPPRADGRAVTYGRGVPLRDRATPPLAGPGTGGYVVVGARAPAGAAPVPQAGRGTASWERLPATAATSAADAEQHRRSPTCGCHACDPSSRRRYRP